MRFQKSPDLGEAALAECQMPTSIILPIVFLIEFMPLRAREAWI
jgi:hypothetical protein